MAKPYPRHYYLNDTVYFITAHVYKKHSYLDSENNKQVLLDTLNNVLDESRYKLYCWVILKDHYHFLFKTRIGEKLPGLMKQIHKLVSIQINDLDEKKRRKVFQNYWDCCIRDKKDFYLHFNYIHQNPVKHGYVEDESEYFFSSYNLWLQKKGKNWMSSRLDKYPATDFSFRQDECFESNSTD